jgi:putative FmdB family regulatory protein
MPIYEFECRACGHRFDHLQKLSDPDPKVCPSCHAEQLQHMLSAPAFRLAGSGWYETDFKKPGDQRHNLAGDAGAPHVSNHDGHAGSKPATTSAGGATATPAATAPTPAPATAKHTGDKAAAAAG